MHSAPVPLDHSVSEAQGSVLGPFVFIDPLRDLTLLEVLPAVYMLTMTDLQPGSDPSLKSDSGLHLPVSKSKRPQHPTSAETQGPLQVPSS